MYGEDCRCGKGWRGKRCPDWKRDCAWWHGGCGGWRRNTKRVTTTGAECTRVGARVKGIIRTHGSRHYNVEYSPHTPVSWNDSRCRACPAPTPIVQIPPRPRYRATKSLQIRKSWNCYSRGTKYCRNMSEIFPIFQCKLNIITTFLSNIAKYFIATLQF